MTVVSPHFIFDFDGTIVASWQLINSHLSEYIEKSNLNVEQLRDMPSDEVIVALGISKFAIPGLILRIRADFKAKLKDQPLVEGIKEALTVLKERGFILHIISSNSKENINAFLAHHGLQDAFTNVISFFGLFGKAYGIKKLLKTIAIEPQDAVYIGDETRDVQAADQAGVVSLAVTWGYNSEKAFQRCKPNYLVRTPMELLEVLFLLCGITSNSVTLHHRIG